MHNDEPIVPVETGSMPPAVGALSRRSGSSVATGSLYRVGLCSWRREYMQICPSPAKPDSPWRTCSRRSSSAFSPPRVRLRVVYRYQVVLLYQVVLVYRYQVVLVNRCQVVLVYRYHGVSIPSRAGVSIPIPWCCSRFHDSFHYCHSPAPTPTHLPTSSRVPLGFHFAQDMATDSSAARRDSLCLPSSLRCAGRHWRQAFTSIF